MAREGNPKICHKELWRKWVGSPASWRQRCKRKYETLWRVTFTKSPPPTSCHLMLLWRFTDWLLRTFIDDRYIKVGPLAPHFFWSQLIHRAVTFVKVGCSFQTMTGRTQVSPIENNLKNIVMKQDFNLYMTFLPRELLYRHRLSLTEQCSVRMGILVPATERGYFAASWWRTSLRHCPKDTRFYFQQTSGIHAPVGKIKGCAFDTIFVCIMLAINDKQFALPVLCMWREFCGVLCDVFWWTDVPC
jgi:hypothetical protein